MVLAGAPRSLSVTVRLQLRALQSLHTSSAERAGTTVDCRSCYIPTCTGSMWHIESGWSSPSQTHSPPVSAQQSAIVPDRLLCRCLVYRWSSKTALSTLSPAGCTALSTNNTLIWTLGRRAFSVAGPTVWNSLPDELRDETENTYRLWLKTLLFRQYYCDVLSAVEVLTTARYINRRFTYLLTRVFTCTALATSTRVSANKVTNDESSGKSNNGLSGKSLSYTHII